MWLRLRGQTLYFLRYFAHLVEVSESDISTFDTTSFIASSPHDHERINPCDILHFLWVTITSECNIYMYSLTSRPVRLAEWRTLLLLAIRRAGDHFLKYFAHLTKVIFIYRPSPPQLHCLLKSWMNHREWSLTISCTTAQCAPSPTPKKVCFSPTSPLYHYKLTPLPCNHLYHCQCN